MRVHKVSENFKAMCALMSIYSMLKSLLKTSSITYINLEIHECPEELYVV